MSNGLFESVASVIAASRQSFVRHPIIVLPELNALGVTGMCQPPISTDLSPAAFGITRNICSACSEPLNVTVTRCDFFLAVAFGAVEQEISGACDISLLKRDRMRLLCIGREFFHCTQSVGQWRTSIRGPKGAVSCMILDIGEVHALGGNLTVRRDKTRCGTRCDSDHKAERDNAISHTPGNRSDSQKGNDCHQSQGRGNCEERMEF